MKKIIEPAKKENAVYNSDFSGKTFDGFGPPVDIKICFNYGSRYDGSELTLHLDDDDVQSILELVKNKTTKRYKDYVSSLLEKYEEKYCDAMSFRDWDHCDILGNNIDLMRYMVDYKDE